MTANVIPLQSRPRATSVTAQERAQAAAWCAAQGPRWDAWSIPADDGSVSVSVAQDDDGRGWLLIATAAGIAVVDWLGDNLGVWPSMAAALARIPA